MSSEEEQIRQRRANLEALEKLGIEIYPRRFDRRHGIGQLVDQHGERTHDELEAERPETTTSGRILAVRSFGKANFLVLSDGHAKIQAYIRQDALPSLDFQIFKLLDFGDWVGVEGRLFRTKTNELTIWASRLHFLAKCLLPLPESGTPDGYRDSLPAALSRSDRDPESAASSKRAAGDRCDSGVHAGARHPKSRRDDATDRRRACSAVQDASQRARHGSLRIAPELYEAPHRGRSRRVFEINRNFGNEGISTQHNPEFDDGVLQLTDYQVLMAMTGSLIETVARQSIGTNEVTFGDIRSR
jgi:lysyl-tRNA synthetase class 2